MKMEKSEIKKRIKKFIESEFLSGKGEVKNDELLFDSGIIDSLGVIELTTFLERSFGVDINSGDVSMDNFDTIEKMANVINEKLKSNE